MEDKEGPKIFGRDISKIPCFRNTFLFSISSGIVSGLGYFLFTSKVSQATRFGFATYIITTLGYWTHCRYNYSVEKFKLRELPQEILTKDDA